MTNCKGLRRTSVLALASVLLMLSWGVTAQDKPYTEGSVWSVTMIRVKPGMFDVYMRDILPVRKAIGEEAKKQGLVLSARILAGNASGKDDFDLMFLEEYKNWAAFDGLSTKYEAIERKIIGPEDKQIQMMTKRVDMREIIGEKTMQEVVMK